MLNKFHALAPLSAVAITSILVSHAPIAQAFAPVTYGYACATNNNLADCAIAEAQFKTTVDEGANANEVKFTFSNTGPQVVVMTNIFFEDLMPETLGNFLRFEGNASVVSYAMEDDSDWNKDPNVPGVRNFSVDFLASPNKPQPIANGIGVGESLSIIFAILPGFNDPINAIITDLQNGTLRTAVRAQAFASGGSETLVNEEVPEPMTILGSAVALAGGAALKRRADNKHKKEKTLIS